MIKWDDDIAPALLKPEFAGTVGAILAFLRAPGDTLLQKAFNLASGIACAIFGLPLAVETLGVKSQTGAVAFSFILGLVGMNLVAKTIDWAAQVEISDLWDLMDRIRGRKAGRTDE